MSSQLKIFYEYSNGNCYFVITDVDTEEKIKAVEKRVKYLFSELNISVKSCMSEARVEVLCPFHPIKNKIKEIGILNFLYGTGIYAKGEVHKGFIFDDLKQIAWSDHPLETMNARGVVTIKKLVEDGVVFTDKDYRPFMPNQDNVYCEYDQFGNVSTKYIEERIEQKENYFEVVDQYTVYGKDGKQVEIVVIDTNDITQQEELNRFERVIESKLGVPTLVVNIGG